jgi:serine/threonine-protein kinase HipA
VTRTLAVWWDGALVGALRLNAHGEMTFAYAESWLTSDASPAISVSLPKRTETYRQRECRPFFAGLLPEDVQREAAAGALGISKRNDFALLDALGGDVAGALTIWPDGATPPAADTTTTPGVLDDHDLADVIRTLPTRPLLAGQSGLRLSLAGSQSKLPVVLIDGRVALPVPGQPTTHILKPEIPRLPATIGNEAFAMRLTSALGLAVAPVDTRTAQDQPYLLVTRYDRRVVGGSVRRLHQEDFCQALGVLPEFKYAEEGGPTFKHSFELLRRVLTRPASGVLALLDAAIANLIVGNADAHGKNFSLLYADGEIGLAPLYDLMTTAAYPDLSATLAMRIGRRATLEEINIGAWQQFAADAGLAAPFVRRRVRELAEAAREAVDHVTMALAESPGVDAAALTKQAALVQARAERLARTV